MTSMGQRAPPPEASPYAQPHHFSLSANPDAPKTTTIVPISGAGKGGERGGQQKMLVESSVLGLIIGRGGQTIKQIQEETGAKIDVSKEPQTCRL